MRCLSSPDAFTTAAVVQLLPTYGFVVFFVCILLLVAFALFVSKWKRLGTHARFQSTSSIQYGINVWEHNTNVDKKNIFGDAIPQANYLGHETKNCQNVATSMVRCIAPLPCCGYRMRTGICCWCKFLGHFFSQATGVLDNLLHPTASILCICTPYALTCVGHWLFVLRVFRPSRNSRTEDVQVFEELHYD